MTVAGIGQTILAETRRGHTVEFEIDYPSDTHRLSRTVQENMLIHQVTLKLPLA